jgi:hypothetical protein
MDSSFLDPRPTGIFAARSADVRPVWQTTGMRHNRTLLASTLRLLQRRYEVHGNSGPRTGIGSLDRLTDGLPPGTAIALVGRPGAGMRSLGAMVATYFLRKRGPVLWVSNTLNGEELMLRILAQVAEIDASRLQRAALGDSDWQKLAVAVEELKRLPLSVIDRLTSERDIIADARGIRNLALVVCEAPLVDARALAAKQHSAVIAIGAWCSGRERGAFDAVLELERDGEHATLTTLDRRDGLAGESALRFSPTTLAFAKYEYMDESGAATDPLE